MYPSHLFCDKDKKNFWIDSYYSGNDDEMLGRLTEVLADVEDADTAVLAHADPLLVLVPLG